MRRAVRLHTFLFLLASLLFLYPTTAMIASPDQILRPLFVLSLLLLVFGWFARQLTDTHTAAFLLSISVLSVCSSPSFFRRAGGYSLVGLLLAWSVARIRRQRMTVDHVHVVVSIVSAFLVATHARPFARILSTGSRVEMPAFPIELKTAASRPDIYFIGLDAYGRADVLDDLYGFDNSEFIRFLESRGFVVPTDSRSNYAKTVLSVTSTLNMDYVGSRRLDAYWWLMSPYINHSRVRSALEKIGYRSVSVATGWDLTNNKTSDIYYSPGRFALNDFESAFLASTPFGVVQPLFERFGMASTYGSHRAAILYTFETLPEVAALPAPKFVFVHVLAPHPPFVFDAAGNPIEPTYPFGFNDANDFPLTDDKYRDGYVGQVRFINKKLMSTVDAILRQSKTPPIVILQADHGPRMFGDFYSYRNSCLKERFSTFSAYFLPGAPKNLIPENITSVNVFRLVFNHYFDGNFPLLESRNFYDQASGVLVDVTDQINTCSRP